MRASRVSSVILLMRTWTTTVASWPTRNEAMGKKTRDNLKDNKNIAHIDDAHNPCLTLSKVKLASARMAGKLDLREFERKSLLLC
eukprot:14930288-Ditylum_brightwellii.AAC.1